MGAVVANVMLMLLLLFFTIPGVLLVAGTTSAAAQLHHQEEVSNFIKNSSSPIPSNLTSEDKRAVPSGSNRLHNLIDLARKLRPGSFNFCCHDCSIKAKEITRHKDFANPSSFSRLVYSQIEEVGWEHLVNLAPDLKLLSFRIRDKKGRVHVVEIQLDETYPKCPPSVSADVPYMFNVEWSLNSRLKDLVQQFQEHLEKLEEFWSTLDDIDRCLCVVDMNQLPRGNSYRQIDIGNGCFILLCINARDPRSIPECRFMGSGPVVNSMMKLWHQNSKQWIQDKTFSENLSSIFKTQLPQPYNVQKNEQQIECGICYSQCLPIDEELGSKSGTGPDCLCDNTSCSRAFHSVCLGDWLRAITTTRQSFDVLFGNCPYCSEPVAVKISNGKKQG